MKFEGEKVAGRKRKNAWNGIKNSDITEKKLQGIGKTATFWFRFMNESIRMKY